MNGFNFGRQVRLMNLQRHLRHVAYEYMVIFIGFALSLFLNVIVDYFLTYKHPYPGPEYQLGENSFGFVIVYVLSTTYIFSIFSPILGTFFKNHYKYFLILNAIICAIWTIKFASDGIGGLKIVAIVVSSCFPMLVSYFLALKINSMYWRSKSNDIGEQHSDMDKLVNVEPKG